MTAPMTINDPHRPGEGMVTFRVTGQGVDDITYAVQAPGDSGSEEQVTRPELPWFVVTDARGVGAMPMLTLTLDGPDAYAECEILTDGAPAVRGTVHGPAATAVFMARAAAS
ncbi:hypothetical protein TPA0598_04_08120 [Streptomyces lydicamycinicus]|uniref:MmpS family membrane protein n=2 Tax=Streptomyces TaxID=1883 RepID=A0A0P4R7I2_9ACTN|nr:hypothetical protein TPA0598_04_08120 [Streptomyces lydicamycinicus]